MGGGKSSSSASTSSSNEDNRVVADGSGVAVGAGATVEYTYTQGLDERAANLVSRVLNTVDNIATGAGGAVEKALKTTQSVAERQQNIEAPTANTIGEFIKSPVAIILASAAALWAYAKGRK
jgi:hypothetical protein